MFTVVLLPQFSAWFDARPRQLQNQIVHLLLMLREEGPRMTMPWAKKLDTDGTLAVFELRPARGNSPARVFYAFDVERAIIVVTGGVKTDARLYERGIAATGKAITERNAAIKKQHEAVKKTRKGKKS